MQRLNEWPVTCAVRLLSVAALSALFWCGAAPAHEVHEHAASQTAPIWGGAAEDARFAAQSSSFQVVVTHREHELVAYLDAFDSNEPVESAELKLEIDHRVVKPRESEPGLYVFSNDLPAGRHSLALQVSARGRTERFSGTIEVPSRPAAVWVGSSALVWLRGGALAGLGFGLAMVSFWNGRRRAAGALLLAVMGVLLLASKAIGHEGPHQQTAAATSGAVAVSKATQRLIGVRTVRAQSETVQPSVLLAGRVIADPNGFARLQAERDGRIEPPSQGFFHVGQWVEKDAVVAYLVPTLTTSEESSLQQTLAQIERDAALLVTRSDTVGIVNPNMPMTEASASLLQELQIQAEGLRKQKEAVLAALQKRIEIHAPLSGIVSRSELTSGQMVSARETLAELVDPQKRLFEALSFDNVRDRQIAGATVMLEDGREIMLVLLGTGPVLNQLATPILFRPEKYVAALEIGMPVRIAVRMKRQLTGVVLPRDALTRDERGQWIVWEHTKPELFVPHAVTPVDIDAAHVLVSGFQADARLVVVGAGLLSQAR